MAIGRETHSSKRSFLGGGKGALIPLGPPRKKRSETPSETPEQSSPLPESYLVSLREEVREQFGASPPGTTEGSD